MNNINSLYTIGYAIISSDCFIADANSQMPDGLRNASDWQYFQSELDSSDLILIGKKSYINFQNSKRNRLIPTSRIKDIEIQKSDLCFFNPSSISIEGAVKIFLPNTTKIAVVGGNKVYDLVFSAMYFNEFHLTVSHSFFMNDGILFNDSAQSLNEVFDLMGRYKLIVCEKKILDKNVTLYIFKK